MKRDAFLDAPMTDAYLADLMAAMPDKEREAVNAAVADWVPAATQVDAAAANFFDLTDDLTVGQFQNLLGQLWVGQNRVTRANVKAWRRGQGLPV